MQVLHVCSEMFPLLKTGGLADVIGAHAVKTEVFPDLQRDDVINRPRL